MEFGYYDLGFLAGGEIVEASISTTANVCLMDSMNFTLYKMSSSFNYYGGYATSSPVRIKVPRGGHWFLTIDLGGRSGRVSFSCNIIRPQNYYDEGYNYTWEGKPAKRYPNRKDPSHFTDVLYGGDNGNSKGDGHGHVIIENSTGEIVFQRRPGEDDPIIWNKKKCP